MITSKYCYLRNRCKKLAKDSSCDKEDIYCIKLFKIDRLYDNSVLSYKQRLHIDLYPDTNGADNDNFSKLKDIEEHINQFVYNGKNLYIHSTITGNGKTSWAIRMIQAFIENNWIESDIDACRALFINVPRFLLELKDNIGTKSEYIDYIKRHIFEADLVVWDEIGVKALSEYDHENLLNLINTRLDMGRSNIYTSNLSSNDLGNNIGLRLYSRIVKLSENIELVGADKRTMYK